MRHIPIPNIIRSKHYWAGSAFEYILIEILQGTVNRTTVESIHSISEIFDIDDFEFLHVILGATPTTNWEELNKLALEELVRYITEADA